MMEFDLNEIRKKLDGYEDTIISLLLERAQYKQNPIAYELSRPEFDRLRENTAALFESLNGKHGNSWNPDMLRRHIQEASFFELRMMEEDLIDSRHGRFCDMYERPFTPFVAAPLRAFSQEVPSRFMHRPDVNYVNKIKEAYIDF